MSTYRLTNRGFTLIELMIMIAIISILVSLALPAYQNYTVRAKASEGLSVGAAAKLAIEESCQTDASINVSTQTGYSFEPSTYVSSVQLFGNCGIMVIAIRTQNTGAERDPMLWLFRRNAGAGNQFFNFAESETWACFGWPEAGHLPSSCRLQNISN